MQAKPHMRSNYSHLPKRQLEIERANEKLVKRLEEINHQASWPTYTCMHVAAAHSL